MKVLIADDEDYTREGLIERLIGKSLGSMRLCRL